MYFQNKIAAYAHEKRTMPFASWQMRELENHQNYLVIPFAHLRREEDFSSLAVMIVSPYFRVVRFQHAFYLGLQGDSTKHVQEKLSGYSPAAMSNFIKIVSYIESHFNLSPGHDSPLEFVLRELIKNALEGAIHHYNPDFVIRDEKLSESEREQMIESQIKMIEKNDPESMRFYISKNRRIASNGQRKWFMNFHILSPEMKADDRERLQNKISIYEKYKVAGKDFNDYLMNEYNAENEEGHGLGMLMLLNLVEGFWSDRARIKFELEGKTVVTLSLQVN